MKLFQLIPFFVLIGFALICIRRLNRLKMRKSKIQDKGSNDFSINSLTYLSAKEGTFDMAYFINEETGKFTFPNYNKDNKNYLVRIKDITKYKEYYFEGRSKFEKDRFSFDEFERIFCYPEFEIDCFEDCVLDSNHKWIYAGYKNPKDNLPETGWIMKKYLIIP